MTRPVEKPRAAPLLVARGVSKSFGKTRALIDASLTLRTGEVCGLLGANGAGKSTLSRIVSGHIRPDGGEMSYAGSPLAPASPREALTRGIALVAQETSLAPDLTVLENIFLPDLATPGRLSWRRMRERAGALLKGLGHEHVLPLDEEARRLSSAQRQLVEIAKALALDARLIIFDEPTASLSATEVARLFDIMARLRDDGRALAFVSHRLEEIFAITDRVTVLRDGVCVADDVRTSDLTQGDIIQHMVGRDIGAVYGARAVAATGETVLQVAGLRAAPWVRDVSFAVRRGEILGLGGLVGAGRSEAVEAVFGLRARQGGEIRVKGAVARIRKPADAIALGIGLVAEDRRAQNIVPDMTVRENLMLAQMGRHRGFGRGFGAKAGQLRALVAALGLPADRLDSSLLEFSGGMQQKIIIARWLLTDPQILILDEPTKGVDIGTRAAIYQMLRDAAAGGLAVVVISSDFEELLGLADRVVVISDGATIADLPPAALTEAKLTLLAAPRTSTARNRALLGALSAEHRAAAFWTLIDGDALICLAAAAHADAPPIGLEPGRAVRATDTLIPAALAARGEGFVVDGDRRTLLRQMTDARGHDLGWIGVTVAANAPRPDAAAIHDQLRRMAPEPEEA